MNRATVIQAVVVVVVAAVIIPTGLHSVREGHVGVYWRGGALLTSVTQPGFHLKLPVVTTWAEVQVTVQTDSVLDIPCGTSGGVMVQVGLYCHACPTPLHHNAARHRLIRCAAHHVHCHCVLCTQQFDKVEVVNRLREDLVQPTIRNYTLDYDKTWVRPCSVSSWLVCMFHLVSCMA